MPRFSERCEAAKLLIQLFDRYTQDPTRGIDAKTQTPDYIKDHVYQRERIFQDFTLKTFRSGYRRLASKWLVNNRVAGQRQGKFIFCYFFLTIQI